MSRLVMLAAFVIPALGACGDLLYVGDEVRSVRVTVEGTTRDVSLEGLGVVTIGANEGGAPLDLILARAAPELPPGASAGYRIDLVTAKGERPATFPECQGVVPIDGVDAESVLLGNKLRNLAYLAGPSLCAPEDVAELVFVRKGEELCRAAEAYAKEGLRRACEGRSCWYCECALQGRPTWYGPDQPRCLEPMPVEPCTDGVWDVALGCVQEPEACSSGLEDYHRARCDETPK